MTVTARIAIEGMNCAFCESAVSTSLSSLPGVTQITTDSRTGQVTVTSARPLDHSGIREAVEGAGFTFVNGPWSPPGAVHRVPGSAGPGRTW